MTSKKILVCHIKEEGRQVWKSTRLILSRESVKVDLCRGHIENQERNLEEVEGIPLYLRKGGSGCWCGDTRTP